MIDQLDQEIIAALERIVAHSPTAGPTPLEMFVRVDDHSPSRRPVLVAAGALALAGVVAIGIVAPQRTDNSASPSAESPDASSAPAPTPAATELTLFPVIGTEAQPGDVGSYSQFGSDNPESVVALVARPVGSVLADGIQIEAVSQPPAFPGAPEPITIHGVNADVYTEQGTPTLRTVVLPGDPVVRITGVDPVGFLQSAGPDIVGTLPVSSPSVGHPLFTLSLGTLPSGYEVILNPFERPRGTTNAAISVGNTQTTEGSLVEVSLMNPLPAYATVGTLTPVDVNGMSGWISSNAGNAVIWEPAAGTFAIVGGSTTPNEALAIARSVRFVDESAWRQFYDVAEPDFGNG